MDTLLNSLEDSKSALKTATEMLAQARQTLKNTDQKPPRVVLSTKDGLKYSVVISPEWIIFEDKVKGLCLSHNGVLLQGIASHSFGQLHNMIA